MADERLDLLLHRLDAPVTPDPAFGDSLYTRIAPLAIVAGRRDRTWYGKVIAALRGAQIGFVRPSPALLRQAVLLAIMLVLLLLVAVFVGSRPPNPNELVRLSEQVYLDPPPFDMTVDYQNGDVRRFRFDGNDVVRLDIVAGSYRARQTGGYILTDVTANRRAEWDPVSGTTSVFGLPSGLRPLHELDLRWGADIDTWNHRPFGSCRNWILVGDEVVAGRRVLHVRCSDNPGKGEEYWVDPATGFVLRSTDVPTDEKDVRMIGQVRTLALRGQVDASMFVFRTDDPTWGALMPGGNEPFQPGVRVVSARFRPAFAATPDEGWRSWGSDRDAVGFIRGADVENATDGAGIWAIRVSTVTDPESGRDVSLAPGAEAVIDWLRSHPYFEVETVQQTRIGSFPATSLPLRHVLPADFDRTCPPAIKDQPVPVCRRWFAANGAYWTYGPAHDLTQATVVDVHGATILILAWADGPHADAHMAAADALLATIEFLE
jgi:hypothetical protein